MSLTAEWSVIFHFLTQRAIYSVIYLGQLHILEEQACDLLSNTTFE